tara:strand:- start:776 stop:1357 length:582 start_codon:yes stop_codon:yes gene_type:complete
MATLTPTLSLTSTTLSDSETFSLSVTDVLPVGGQNISFQVVLGNTLHTTVAAAANYTKSYVMLKNLSTTSAEVITITHASFTHADCDINNATGITDITGIHGAKVNMQAYHPTGKIPIGGRVTAVTDATDLVLGVTTTGGDLDNQTLTFANSVMELGAEEFAFFPWSSVFDLGGHSASGTPTLEVRIFQAANA